MNCKLYIFEGENEFLIQKEIDLLIKKANLKKEDLEFISYNLLDTNLDNVVEDLDTYNMFLKKKVITVTNPIFLEEKIPDNFPIKSFLKYMKNPSDNILIFITKKVNNRLKLTSEILNYFTLIKIKEISPFAFLKENIQGYKMDSSLISYFLNKVGTDFHNIFQEIEKLKIYKIKTKEILKEDIDLITNSNIEANIFDLIEAIIKKDKKKSYQLYNHFISNGTEIFQILILLASQIRLIYNVKTLANFDDFSISQILEVKEYPIKLARSRGYNYSKQELLHLLYELSLMDEDIKSGKQLPDISFLTFIMQM